MATSNNVLLAFPNRSDVDAFYQPVFLPGYGNWQDTDPLTNLQNRFLAYKTRSIDCDPNNSQFVIDLGNPVSGQPATNRMIQVVVIPNHNVSRYGTYTVNTYTDAALTNQTSTTTNQAWPVVFPYGSLAWEHESWLDGKLTPERGAFYPQPLLVVLPTAVLCRYVQVIVNDPTNTAGYIELSRLVCAPGWQPSINMKYGAQIGVNDHSIKTTSLGEVDFYDPRAKRRKAAFSIDYLPQNEAFGNALDMQISQGLSGQIFFSYSPTDTANLNRLSFLATLTQLDPLTAASYGYQGVSFNLEEVVG